MALYRSPEHETSFVSVGLSIQEKMFKIVFQDGGCGGLLRFLIGVHGGQDGQLGFPNEKKWLFLIYKSPRYSLQSFESIGLLD